MKLAKLVQMNYRTQLAQIMPIISVPIFILQHRLNFVFWSLVVVTFTLAGCKTINQETDRTYIHPPEKITVLEDFIAITTVPDDSYRLEYELKAGDYFLRGTKGTVVRYEPVTPVKVTYYEFGKPIASNLGGGLSADFSGLNKRGYSPERLSVYGVKTGSPKMASRGKIDGKDCFFANPGEIIIHSIGTQRMTKPYPNGPIKLEFKGRDQFETYRHPMADDYEKYLESL